MVVGERRRRIDVLGEAAVVALLTLEEEEVGRGSPISCVSYVFCAKTSRSSCSEYENFWGWVCIHRQAQIEGRLLDLKNLRFLFALRAPFLLTAL